MGQPKGKRVRINADPYGVEPNMVIDATVEELLAVQFTARWDSNGALSFLFYGDEGSTWENADDTTGS